MKITDPTDLLNSIDGEEFNVLRGLWSDKLHPVEYVEPILRLSETSVPIVADVEDDAQSQDQDLSVLKSPEIKGKAILFGDNVDTDAVSFCAKCLSTSTNDACSHVDHTSSTPPRTYG